MDPFRPVPVNRCRATGGWLGEVTPLKIADRRVTQQVQNLLPARQTQHTKLSLFATYNLIPLWNFLWGRLCPCKLRTNQIMLSSQASLPTLNFLAPPLTIIIGMQSDRVCQIKKDKRNQSIIIADICFQ